jgi:prepilin-type N-terminal cleavage/methylation domain-containing protein
MNQKGFTLIEILVVVALFVLLVAVSVIIAFDSINRSSVHGERDLIVLMLTGARTRALANVNQAKQGVYINNSTITLFEGDSYGSGTNKRVTTRSSGVLVSPNPSEVVFDRVSGKIPSNVSITLTSEGKSAVIDINTEGRIEW